MANAASHRQGLQGLDGVPEPLPPGWYPDPLGGPAAQYWNGTEWDSSLPAEAAPQEFPTEPPQKQRFLVPTLIGAVCLLAGILLVLLWPKHEGPTAAPPTATFTPPVTITQTQAAPTATTTPADRVAKMVRDSMQRKFDSEAAELGLKVPDVSLVNKAGNEYKGFAEVRARNGEERQVSVEVTADGDNVLWEIPPGELAFAESQPPPRAADPSLRCRTPARNSRSAHQALVVSRPRIRVARSRIASASLGIQVRAMSSGHITR